MDFTGVANESIGRVENGLTCMALSAERHVHILAPDHINVILAGRAKGETSILLAQLADGCEFGDLFALGDEGDDVGEGSSEEGTLQA